MKVTLRSADVSDSMVPAGENTLTIRRLIVPLTAAVVTLHAGQVFAQGAFPSQGSAPVSSGFSEPPPQASGSAEACTNGFSPLREEAERRGKLIKAASDRKAPPDEACKLIGNFGQAELKMIKYVEANSAKCGIPPEIAEQLRTGHKNTDKMQKQVCTMAQRRPSAGVGPGRSAGAGRLLARIGSVPPCHQSLVIWMNASRPVATGTRHLDGHENRVMHLKCSVFRALLA
jgi:hypothetical protein